MTEKMVRGFYHFANAWYSKDWKKNKRFIDDIYIGMYEESGAGGSAGEFSIVWEDLGGSTASYIRLFNDGWHLLSEFKDLFERLSKLSNKVTPEKICKILIELGFKDFTPTEKP